MCSETSLIVASPELRTQQSGDPELVGNVARQMILRRDSIDLVAEKIINHDNLSSVLKDILKATYEQRMNKSFVLP
ncbi:MAG: hypothetical protein M3044_02600 [Thermoproteota archaeon]|nr:hypothetical protein [Thermoproteota archaeon]